ncbi:MAG: hypothetical protein R2941_14660 [Desulfobacterales bacterium]
MALFRISAFRAFRKNGELFQSLWDEMAEILSRRESFADDSESRFCALCSFSLAQNGLAAKYWAVIGNNISVREQPGLDSL